MTAVELVAARQTLELSLDALAARLMLTPAVVRAFEEGRLAMPARHARLVEWLLAAHEQERALAARELPACAWAERWAAEPEPRGGRARAAHTRAVADHMVACPQCQARQASLLACLPPLPVEALAPTERVIVALVQQVERLPRWARPVAYGGAVFGVAAVLRVVLALVTGDPTVAR